MIDKLIAPILKNNRFALFMYLLGLIPVMLIHHGGRHVSVFELIVDIYLVCLVLYFLPDRIAQWMKLLFYIFAYSLTIIDVFCFYRFGAPINAALFRLCAETNQREATEALSSYVTLQSIPIVVYLIILLMLIHFATSKYQLKIRIHSWLIAIIVIFSFVISIKNKVYIFRNFTEPKTSIEYEFSYDLPHDGGFYLPFYRLLHAWKGYSIDKASIEKMEQKTTDIVVDSCSFKSPNIVFIIGEAYNRNHSQLYGYTKATTPLQMKLARDSSLIFFTDVVSPYHQTSEVFRLVFSLYSYGQQGNWTDYPLFPQLFKKAGYQVSFITNQFVQSPAQDVFDFNGSLFLNTPTLSQSMFSHRNTHTHRFDMGLLEDYDSLQIYQKEHNLIIFHLLGLHTSYKDRHTEKEEIFSPKDYQRKDLSKKDLSELAHYDNACLYNDKVVAEIINRFVDKEAIVIYMPDHGEMCFDETNVFGRTLEVNTTNEVKQQFEIPFWIWTSDSYQQQHPDICRLIKEARHQPFMTDNISHVLLYLAGIHSSYYREKDNLLSPHYDMKHKRMLMGTINYDEIVAKEDLKRISLSNN